MWWKFAFWPQDHIINFLALLLMLNQHINKWSEEFGKKPEFIGHLHTPCRVHEIRKSQYGRRNLNDQRDHDEVFAPISTLLNAKNCEFPKKSQWFLSFEKTSARFHTSHMRIFEEIREFCDTVVLMRASNYSKSLVKTERAVEETSSVSQLWHCAVCKL
jgi:hypothetical protein